MRSGGVIAVVVVVVCRDLAWVQSQYRLVILRRNLRGYRDFKSLFFEKRTP